MGNTVVVGTVIMLILLVFSWVMISLFLYGTFDSWIAIIFIGLVVTWVIGYTSNYIIEDAKEKIETQKDIVMATEQVIGEPVDEVLKYKEDKPYKVKVGDKEYVLVTDDEYLVTIKNKGVVVYEKGEHEFKSEK